MQSKYGSKLLDDIVKQRRKKIEQETKKDDNIKKEGNENEPKFVHISDDAIDKMKVNELKDELKKRNAPVGGKKNELVKRLKKCIEDKVVVGGKNKEKSSKPRKNNGLGSFIDGAYWKILEPESNAVVEPVNKTFKKCREPTIDKDAADYFVPIKHNFSFKLKIPSFMGMIDTIICWANGKPKLNKDGTMLKEKKKIEKGTVDPDFMHKHNLTPSTTPSEYIELLLPLDKNMHGSKEMFSFDLATKWTNMKAVFANAGPGGNCYTDYIPFTPTELRRHVGLYLFNGLVPSPRVEYKFCLQREDKIHGNDFINRSFGRSGERRHWHFKAFFHFRIHQLNSLMGSNTQIGRYAHC